MKHVHQSNLQKRYREQHRWEMQVQGWHRTKTTIPAEDCHVWGIIIYNHIGNFEMTKKNTDTDEEFETG